MDKTYNHLSHEQKTYQLWESSGAFKPEINPKGEPYCIIMPPPNANEALHIGHARFIAIQDTLIRYQRMQGKAALWLPGTDHAGIETQYVFEKKLAKQDKSRFDYDRETLYQMIWNYVQEQGDTAIKQMKSLGASADWTRTKFTLDNDIVKIVYQTFKQLHDDHLLYRGQRLVNYCTKCGTSFSDLEIENEEIEGQLYYIKFPLKTEKPQLKADSHITIATTRPETFLGDVAVMVHPADKRYKNSIGKTVILPLVNREIPVIADKYVDKKFGTGAVKVTPNHDFNDFEIAKKHKLTHAPIIGFDGKMKNTGLSAIDGLRVLEAREKIIQILKEKNFLERVTPHRMVIKKCYKTKTILEPLPLDQWFIKVRPLADKALQAVKQKETTFVADQYRKIHKHWLKNLEDWNISRQIVWGIRIPAWKCPKCNEWTITDGSTPKQCSKCKHSKLVQDPDTFDTWFSSGQWPFATLQALDQRKNQTTKQLNFKKFYPTTVMETAYDILKFWVSRMMMLGIYRTGQVPFKHVLIHGLIRDGQGRKISKSIGNVINPLDWSDKYGTDALRFSLVYGGLLHSDLPLSEDKVRGMRNFANKLWNIARFLELSFEDIKKPKNQKTKKPLETLNLKLKTKPVPWYKSNLPNQKSEDKAIIKKLSQVIAKTAKYLDEFKLNEAAQLLYDFIWHDLADVYIETVKNRIKTTDNLQPTTNHQLASLSVLRHIFLNTLKLIHPFMPFVTETLWQELKNMRENPKELLITAKWPS